jgi:hypothetical protein
MGRVSSFVILMVKIVQNDEALMTNAEGMTKLE